MEDTLKGVVYGAVGLYLLQRFHRVLLGAGSCAENAATKEAKQADHDFLANRALPKVEAVGSNKTDDQHDQENKAIADDGAKGVVRLGFLGADGDDVLYRDGQFVYVRGNLGNVRKGFLEVRCGSVILAVRNTLFNRIRFGVFGHGFSVVKVSEMGA